MCSMHPEISMGLRDSCDPCTEVELALFNCHQFQNCPLDSYAVDK